MIAKRIYTLPITGKMKDWATLSGDPDDPVTIAGPVEFARMWPGWGDVPEGEKAQEISLMAIDWDTGEAKVQVQANDSFLNALEAYLVGKSCSDVDADCGRPHLKRPPDAPISLLDRARFNGL